MPIYQYNCEKCKNSFELRQSFHDDNDAPCPKCNSKSKRIFLPVPIIFKGSGFYVTDHKKPSGDQSVAKVAETSKEVSIPPVTETKPQAIV